MTTKTATKTHRVFDAIQGLWPVTFANVREADPEGLLDIFEGAENTRDAYFEAVITTGLHATKFNAGCDWADSLQGFDTDHGDDCDQGPGAYKSSDPCSCKKNQYANNQRWGQYLWEDIEERIDQLND